MKKLMRIREETAFILPSLLISVMMITMLGVTIMLLVASNYRAAARDVHRLNAQLAADAGLDDGVVNLNLDNDWVGSGGEFELYNDGDTKLTYETTVDEIATGVKRVNSTGRTYVPASATNPIVERQYEIVLEGLAPAEGDFSLVTGVGGLIMENSSKIVAGEVFVNGDIIMRNSAQIGLSTSPVLVKAAHQSCPTTGGPTYPEICTSGEPIDITNPAWIYADVCANNQVTGDRMSGSGLINPIVTSSCGEAPTITPLPLPTHDRAGQIAAAGAAPDIPNYDCSSASAPPVIWPANYRVGGDVNLKQKCEIIIEGDVWIEGNLDLENSTKITVSDTADLGVDGNRPTIMVDGPLGITLSNSSEVVANASDVGAQLITYYSTAACSPDCADVTGDDLFNSRNITTIKLEQLAQAAESMIYSRWTRAEMDNGGDVGAIIGQTVFLRNSATITFGAGTGGGSGGSSVDTFVVRSYRQVF
ncbi:MAG: hypothetical protein R3313_01365 [Candidatus Saccharimonadales bacterium]|nr:hypothetical protein [Candidatus Saccharimonadales bacterium]